MGSEAVKELVVRCLQLQLRGLSLLVPNTTVAEVSGYLPPEPMAQAPEWLLGTVLWRGASVPLVSYELMLGRDNTMHSQHRRIVIMNTIRTDSLLPFVAIEVQGIPRLIHISEDMLSLREEERENPPMVASDVMFEGKNNIIPDLAVIEKMLLQLGLKVH